MVISEATAKPSPGARLWADRAYGIEIDPTYCDLIVRRLEALSKHRAILVGDGRAFEAVAAERGLHSGGEVAA